MKIQQVRLNRFRRFTDLTVSGLLPTTRLVMLAGPNGCGKSSFLDGLNLYYQINSPLGWGGDENYYAKSQDPTLGIQQRASISFHDHDGRLPKGAFYFRSAYRNDPEFSLGSLSRLGPTVDDIRFRRMIEGDATVSTNYQRLASQALQDVFALESPDVTIGAFRERVIGNIRDAISRLFPDLILNDLGNPLSEGTFRFDKGSSKAFEYKNLSGGEKAAFDLILDIVVKRNEFTNSVYCIDEPEAHMNTRLQADLLEEMFQLIPPSSQLWVATHSIGMMRRARDLSARSPGEVAFLDFGDHDFDTAVEIQPSNPTRTFWEGVLHVALDDLATLVAPKEVIICEGSPLGIVASKNVEHDAIVYGEIFSREFPDVKFISAGNSHSVASDKLGFVAALPKIAQGITVRRLIDRDDHAPQDTSKMELDGIRVLRRRHLEAYLYDDEVLSKLCESVGKPEEISSVLAEKQASIAASVAWGNPSDDIKSAAGEIYTKIKKRLCLTAIGNDQMAFSRNALAPLIIPGMSIYSELKQDVFGS